MKTGDKTFYDVYWKEQLALTCDERCRLSFILSQVDNVIRRKAKAAINLGSRLRTPDPKRRLRIADVGCGRGWLTDALSRFGEVVGFDQSTVEAARRYPHLRLVECDVLDLGRTAEAEAAGEFDVAVCSEVIEHVRREDQHRLVESIAGILRDDGTLILTTPNRPVVNRLVEALGLREELQPIEDWLDARALAQLLRPQFEAQELTTVMFFPVWVRKVGPLSRAYRTLYESCGAHRAMDPVLGPTLRGLYLAVVARKKPASPSAGISGAV